MQLAIMVSSMDKVMILIACYNYELRVIMIYLHAMNIIMDSLPWCE